jgi:hypothetical protein
MQTAITIWFDCNLDEVLTVFGLQGPALHNTKIPIISLMENAGFLCSIFKRLTRESVARNRSHASR